MKYSTLFNVIPRTVKGKEAQWPDFAQMTYCALHPAPSQTDVTVYEVLTNINGLQGQTSTLEQLSDLSLISILCLVLKL